jgi:hypothetical protein
MDQKRADLIHESLTEARTLISNTIDDSLRVGMTKTMIVRDQLIELKALVGFSESTQEAKIREDLAKQGKSVKHNDLDNWLLKWNEIHAEVQMLKVQTWYDAYSVCRLFINAIQSLCPAFHSYWLPKLINRDVYEREKSDISIPKLIISFREFYDASSAAKPVVSVAFPTLNGQPLSGNRKLKDRKCLCGEEHLWMECPYLNPEVRSEGWKPDQKIAKSITKKRKDNPVLNSHVKRHLKKARKSTAASSQQSQTKQLGSFMTIHKPNESAGDVTHQIPLVASATALRGYPRNSFMLNSGANIHVYHDIGRFQNLRRVHNESLIFGDTRGKIVGYGNILINIITGGDKQKFIILKDIAYYPKFHLNIVSYTRMHDGGLWWDTKFN